MNIGKLDRRITLQSPTTVRGETGGHEELWTDAETLWANVRDLSGRETFTAQAAGSQVSKIVTIRYLAAITAAMRVKFSDGSVSRISHLIEVGRKEWLEIYCERVT